jgi:hypothetical protein
MELDMRTVSPPVVAVDELFDFIAAWHDLPADLERVPIPQYLPRALRDLHARFGLAATKEHRFDRNFETGYGAQGIFAVQDMLVPISRLEENIHIAPGGPYKGQRMLTFVHEAQWCHYLHVPLEGGEDPPVFVSDLAYVNPNRPVSEIVYEQAAGKLSEFLAVHVLRETVIGAPYLWMRITEAHRSDDYLIRWTPLLTDTCYVYPYWPCDFYVDETENLLLMRENYTDFNYIASKNGNLEAILRDPKEVDDLRRDR